MPGPYQPISACDLAVISDFNLPETLSFFEGNKQLVLQLIELFLTDAAPIFNTFCQALQAGEPARAGLHIHHLKSMVRNFGDHRTARYAERFELLLDAGLSDRIAPNDMVIFESMLKHLSEQLTRARKILSRDNSTSSKCLLSLP